MLGILASIALTRRRFRLKAGVSALLLSPLVIPYVVFGVSLLLLFHTLGIPRSILTVVIGHIVITLPYTILVLMPGCSRSTSLSRRPRSISAPSRLTHVPLDHAPADPAGGRVRVPDRVHDLVRRVRGRVVRSRQSRTTFPIYLYSALRFPSQLPQVIAVAVVVILISLTVVVAAEVGRRAFERRVAVET